MKVMKRHEQIDEPTRKKVKLERECDLRNHLQSAARTSQPTGNLRNHLQSPAKTYQPTGDLRYRLQSSARTVQPTDDLRSRLQSPARTSQPTGDLRHHVPPSNNSCTASNLQLFNNQADFIDISSHGDVDYRSVPNYDYVLAKGNEYLMSETKHAKGNYISNATDNILLNDHS